MDATQIAQITDMMYALRNPAGVPTYPIIFIGLGVLTFALHMLFVNLVLGGSMIAIFGAYRNNDNWRRLGNVMLEIAKVSVSVAIVIGVAPLLFVQVVYDPHWYTSNVLSADWVIAFILILILAYWAMYYFYFRNAKRDDVTAQPTSRWSLLISFALMLVVGFIMHSLTSQILHPEQWQDWYLQDGKLDYSGSQLHAYNPWRFAFFISLSILVTGAMMVTYRRFKSVRSDADHTFLNWTANLGKKWIQVGVIVSTLLYVMWMQTIPDTAGDFASSFWGYAGAAALIFYGVWALIRLRGEAAFCSYMALPMALVVGLVIATSREMLRYAILNDTFHYDFMDYKVVMDWYSTGLFFLTFAVVGGSVLTYFLTIAWKAGQTVGVYTPSATVDRIGTAAIWIMVLWMIQFFVVGFYVWAQ